jgi:hypothetical protein
MHTKANNCDKTLIIQIVYKLHIIEIMSIVFSYSDIYAISDLFPQLI